MNIRKICETDRDTVLTLMLEFYHSAAVLHPLPEDTIQRCLADCIQNSPYIEGYVMEAEETIAGFAMVAKGYATEAGGMCVQIEDIFVRPEFRGQGTGKQFFAYIMDKYKDTAYRFRLEVEENNTNAIRLYKKLGFVELPYCQMIKER